MLRKAMEANPSDLLVFSFLVLWLAGCQNPSQEDAKMDAPNIVFILADDLGKHDLGCTGSTYYETPNIDRIASSGFNFTNGYANCQVCSPSRASLMTGKFPSAHGITDWIGARSGTEWRKHKRYNAVLPAGYNRHLPHEDITMAEAFQKEGYKTFFAGKWHLGNEGSYPEDHGFDINIGGHEKGGPYPGGFFAPFQNPKMEDHDSESGMDLPQRLARETVSFIEDHKDQPFLAYLSFYAVHAPIQTTPQKWSEYRSKAADRGIDSVGFEMERRLPIRKHQDNPVYAGLIEHMDEAVGMVLDHLQKSGLEDNTIVIFTSDNGGVASGDNYSTSNRPLRGGKGYQWEGGIRVPLLMKIPWIKAENTEIFPAVTGADLYPTLLDLARIAQLPDQHIDGKSVLPLLTDDTQSFDRSLVWHYPHYGNQGGDPSSIIRRGDWKLIYYHEDESIELYQIEKDFAELNDLSRDSTSIALQLKNELLSHLKKRNAIFPLKDPAYNSDSAAYKLAYYRTDLKSRLEEQRLKMLSEEWQPNEDWWGSQVKKTID